MIWIPPWSLHAWLEMDRSIVTTGTVLAPVAASMVRAAAARGLDANLLLARLGLDAVSAGDPERRVPQAAMFAVWADCMRALDDPGLPLAAAQQISLADYAVLGFATTSAPNFRAALALLGKYGALLADDCRWSMEEEHDAPLRLVWRREGIRSLGHRVANECAIAEALHVARQMLGARFVPLAVAFRHSAPSEIASHLAYFGVRPQFDATWEGLELPRHLLDQIPRHANPPLATYLERQLLRELASRPVPTTIGEKVERLLEQDLPSGQPSLRRIARALAVSERTLRRQLQRETLGFRALWERVRRGRAEMLLATGSASLDEVAFLTGYSDTAAFTRAFKRWSGQTPGAFRRGATDRARGRSGQDAGRSEQ